MTETTTHIRAWAAEGARVGLTTCTRCGAAILVDPATEFDVVALHDDWHAKNDTARPRARSPEEG